jgi:hypothetical protein
VLHQRNFKHGQGARGNRTREYKAWKDMKKRCYQTNSKSYQWYGAKGVTVSDAWVNNYAQFFLDMGICPLNYELDRIDNSKGYEQSNCRWVSQTTQSQNRTYV